MKHLFRAFAIGLITVFTVSCGKKKAETGFYFWESGPRPDAYDFRILDSAKTRHIYLKMFEVHWNQALREGVPQADLDYLAWDFQDSLSLRMASDRWNLIPVVFIHPEVFKYAGAKSGEKLAKRVFNRVIDHVRNRALYRDYSELSAEDSVIRFDELRIPKRAKPVKERITEIQIDCDWTESGKDQYFEFLRELKKVAGDIRISVTLRLYPFRYPEKAGVPPADKAVLMCYNMGDLEKQDTVNSILDAAVLESYLKPAKKYPLDLDVALPAFDWAVWYRSGKLKGLLRSRGEVAAVIGASRAMSANARSRAVMMDTVLGKDYFRLGDVVKLEKPDAQSLEEAATLLNKYLPGKIQRIVFFDASSEHLKTYRNGIYRAIQKF